MEEKMLVNCDSIFIQYTTIVGISIIYLHQCKHLNGGENVSKL
jgi:hypothetical protein